MTRPTDRETPSEPRILDGRRAAAEIRAEVADDVRQLVAAGGRPPGLTAVLVGDDPASQVYVGSKTRASEEAGIVGAVLRLPSETTQVELLATVDGLNADDAVDGILVQLPLPGHLDSSRVLERIDPAKDVDGFHPVSVGRLWLDRETFVPATPSGIVELLERNGVEIEGRRAVIVGRSHLVGKPLAALLLRRNATVTFAHSRTQDLKELCRGAELLVAAIGRPAFFGEEHVAPGTVVVDVGINRLEDRAEVERLFPDRPERLETFERRGSVLVGDVDPRAFARAAAYTPVPGGVGPLTVACLLVNTVRAARRRQGTAAAPGESR